MRAGEGYLWMLIAHVLGISDQAAKIRRQAKKYILDHIIIMPL